MVKIAVLVSGGGTNLQAIIDAKARGEIPHGEIECVIASKPGVFALERAAKAGIEGVVIAKKGKTAEEFDSALCEELTKRGIGLVVLAGFLTILGEKVLSAFPNRIINIHPSLIPSFCGDGYYGLKVHEEALRYGVKVTGATVHLVNEVTDGGAILLQRAVEILPDDTAEVLQRRVMEQAEWKLLPQAVEAFCAGKIIIENGRAKIIK